MTGILVYTQTVTPRIRYIFRHVLKHILEIDVEFASNLETFVAHQGAKLSYGDQPMGSGLFVQSHGLLQESGIRELDLTVTDWASLPCFFPCSDPSSCVPYDIFAASFFLITRYEEYQRVPSRKIPEFDATHSLAYTYRFLQSPVVDLWAYRFREVMEDTFGTVPEVSRRTTILPMFVVSDTFKYKRKGILRSVGRTVEDLSRLQLTTILERMRVLLKIKRDPYDSYEWILRFRKQRNLEFLFLFGLGNYSRYEKNIGYLNKSYRMLIKSVADHATVGLRLSYAAVQLQKSLKIEKERLEGIINYPPEHSVCSDYKIMFPETYRNLVESEITHDYSMGYPTHAGFRAGTCIPFFFYDLVYEIQTPLRVHSFCCTPQSFDEIYDPKVAKVKFTELQQRIIQVQGECIPAFSNALFTATERGRFWRKVFGYLMGPASESSTVHRS